MSRMIFASLVVGLAAGCAFGPGDSFAELHPTVRAQYVVPEDRAVEGGFARLSSDYQVRIDEAVVELGAAELTATSGGGGGGTFDPANPPPGYSLCHGGHCHRDDGALIPYEEIQAELSGGPSRTTLVTLPVNEAFNLLEAREITPGCEPDCLLDRTEVTAVRMGVSRILFKGVARDGRASPRIMGEVPFTIEWPAGTAPETLFLEARVELPIDRAHPPEVLLEAAVIAAPSLFDGIDFAAPVDAAGREQFLEAFTRSLVVDITRVFDLHSEEQ